MSVSLSFAMEEADKTTKPQNNSSLILMSQKLCQKITEKTSKIIENPFFLQAQEKEEISQYNKADLNFLKFLIQQNILPQGVSPPSLPQSNGTPGKGQIDSLEDARSDSIKKVRVLEYTPSNWSFGCQNQTNPTSKNIFQVATNPTVHKGLRELLSPKIEPLPKRSWETFETGDMNNERGIGLEERQNRDLEGGFHQFKRRRVNIFE